MKEPTSAALEPESVYGRWLPNEQHQNLSGTPPTMGGKHPAYLQLMRMKNVILASITVPLGAQFALVILGQLNNCLRLLHKFWPLFSSSAQVIQ